MSDTVRVVLFVVCLVGIVGSGFVALLTGGMGGIFHAINQEMNVPEDLDLTGTAAEGTVTGISTKHNVTVNGQHPVVVEYTYLESDEDVTGYMTTFDAPAQLSIGAIVTIRHRDGASKVEGWEPAQLPAKILLAVAFICGVVSFACLILAWIFRPFWRKNRAQPSYDRSGAI